MAETWKKILMEGDAPTAHAASHAVGGGDTIFPADPGADKYLMWDDSASAPSWEDAGGGGTSVPTGTIIAHPKACPSGYLVCDGSAVSRVTYATLYTLLGDMYGNGDGSTTFNLPDLRGYFLRGQDSGAGNDPDAASRTDRGDGTTGDNVGTKQADDYKSHTHSASSVSNGAHSHNNNIAWVLTTAGGSANYATTTGYNSWHALSIYSSGSHTHTINVVANGGNETRPINMNVLFCIKY